MQQQPGAAPGPAPEGSGPLVLTGRSLGTLLPSAALQQLEALEQLRLLQLQQLQCQRGPRPRGHGQQQRARQGELGRHSRSPVAGRTCFGGALPYSTSKQLRAERQRELREQQRDSAHAVVSVRDPPPSGHSLLLAARAAAAGALPHEELAAMFDRVNAGIDEYELTRVEEEEEEEEGRGCWEQQYGDNTGSGECSSSSRDGEEVAGERGRGGGSGGVGPLENATFLTGAYQMS